jgi:hypothetical protein
MGKLKNHLPRMLHEVRWALVERKTEKLAEEITNMVTAHPTWTVTQIVFEIKRDRYEKWRRETWNT